MEGVQIPSYFLCPITLQLMRDPVTLPTGITYDRDSIERWILSGRQTTCPVTNQPLPPPVDLTPNHTLRRIIQSWCADNASQGVEQLPDPRPPVDYSQLAALLEESRLPGSRLRSLKSLRNIISDSDLNKRRVAAPGSGVVDFLASLISTSTDPLLEEDQLQEALCILYTLQQTEQQLHLVFQRNEHFLDSLASIMQRSNYQCRAYAILLIKSLLKLAPPAILLNLPDEFFHEIIRLLRDRVSYQAMSAAMKVLCGVFQYGRNTTKAAEAGAAVVLVELLLDEPEKKACEMMLVVLNDLCRCPKGREAVVGHAAGVAVVSKKILRVSAAASERAMRILYLIARHAASPEVVEEMAQIGVVAKMCLLLNVECGNSVREMAKEILRLHSGVWRRMPCITAPQLRVLRP